MTGGAALITLSSIGGCVIAVAAHAFWPLAIITVPGVIGGAVLRARARRAGPPPLHPRISAGDFRQRYLNPWGKVHGRIEKLLPPAVSQPAPAAPPSDAAAFSFDRALVTGHASIAAMLVANNFHFENNCAILSTDGYPQHVAATLMTMLAAQPAPARLRPA